MKNGVLLLIAALIFASPLMSFSFTVHMDVFPYKRYLFRMMKIPYEDWAKMDISKETVRELVFTYNGKTYSCLNLKCGEIFVTCSDKTKMIYCLPIKNFKYKTMTVSMPNEWTW